MFKNKTLLMLPLSFLWHNPFISYIILFINYYVSPRSWWYFAYFLPSFPMFVFKKINALVTEYDTVLKTFCRGSVLHKIQKNWGKYPFALVWKGIALIYSSPTLKLEANFLQALLNPVISNIYLHHSFEQFPSYE